MRPKFVIAVLSLTALLLGSLLWLKREPDRAFTTPPAGESPSLAMPAKPTPTLAPTQTQPIAPAPAVASALTPEQQRAAVEAEVQRLTQLCLQSDPASLPAILSALTDPSREIREAAIEATMEVGDSNAIPVLK